MRRYVALTDFKITAVRHLGFWTVKRTFCLIVTNFAKTGHPLLWYNSLSSVSNQFASSCRISSISVKRLRRYGDSAVFKMAAVRHPGVWTFKFLTVRTIKRRMLHSRANVREARPIHNSDMASFVVFKMAATAVLDFQKFEILTVCPWLQQLATTRLRDSTVNT